MIFNTGLTVLIVDDNEPDRRYLIETLETVREEICIRETDGIEEAIALLKKGDFDCMFLKENLGNISETLQDIRQQKIETPIIILTEEEDRTTRLEWEKIGISDVLIPREIIPEILYRSLYAAVGIHRARGEAQQIQKRLQDSERRSHFLASATTLLSTSLDYQTTLNNLAHLIVPYLADWCTINLADREGTPRLIAVAHVNPQRESLVWQLQHHHRTAQTLKVFQTGKPVICETVSKNSLGELAIDSHQQDILEELQFCSYLCVPLRTRERILGSILCVLGESDRHYRQSDRELAEDLADRAALAIENAKLYQEAREANARLAERKQHLTTLQKLTNLLNQRLTNLKDLLKVMARSVTEAIAGAQFCFIALYDCHECQTSLTVTAGEGVDRLPLDRAFSVGGWLHQVFATGEANLMQTPSHPLFPFPAALYAVPIQSARSGRLGVLGVGHWQNIEAFARGDGILLLAVGEQAAIAIDNAQLIQTLEEREERLERQNQTLARQNRKLATQRQQIHQQNLQLIEAAKMKSQFLATMSHELRTPMNAIIGFSQVLLRQRSGSLSSHQVQMIERIHNNGKNLLELINDILDLSKIEAKKLEIKPGFFNVSQLVCTTLESLRPLADEKNLELYCDCQCNLKDKKIFSDRDRLRQILVNLLSNAIKFTETGSVTVGLEELPCDRLKIIVRDTGIGIAENRQQRIFEEFYQGDQTTTRKYSGTGLGLAITKSLVELMKGKIELESQLGKGTTFLIELPCVL
ncbi:MAG: ATP-binding protein [Spirulina sp.]